MQTIRFESSNIGPYLLQVQGEACYRKNIEDIAGYYNEDEGINDDSFWAHLVLEDENPYDRGNAVRVDIDGKTVGYLSRPYAKQYRSKLKELGLTDVIGECRASIKGGFAKRDGTVADFGVRLDVDINALQVYKPSTPKLKPTATPEPPRYVVPSEPKQPKPLLKWAFAPERYKTIVIILVIIFIVLYAWMNKK